MRSLFVFCAGVGGMIGCDWIAARSFTNEAVAEWMIVKSLVLFLGVMLTLGFERCFLRIPQSAPHILKFSVLNVAMLAPLIFVVLMFALSDVLLGLWVTFASVGLALSIAYSEKLRAAQRMALAQAALNGWKIVLVALFATKVMFGLGIEPPEMTLMATLSVAGLFSWGIARGVRESGEGIEYRKLLADARFFLLFNLLLVATSYADQFIVGLVLAGPAARSYLAHATLFLAPFLFVAAFLGFQLAPRLRNRDIAKFVNPVIVIGSAIGLLILSVAVLAALGPAAMLLLYGEAVPFEFTIAALMAAVGVFRIMYAIPSAVLGVLGSQAELRRFLAINVGLFVAQIGLTALLLIFEMPAVLAILLPCLMHWVGKSTQGVYQSWSVLRPS
tara:strand:+ start:5087 stop:6250 length:1164 start_codon:yes stop_codon:yes gene_type:complete